MYIPRILSEPIREGLLNNPVTAVTGPRQCGKSTLVKAMLSEGFNYIYLDLERPSDLNKLEHAEWFLQSQKKSLICLDEIQRKPDLFPLIRSLVDDWNGNSHFLILGSASRDLLRQSSESLAGRISYKSLTPFLWKEINEFAGLEEYMHKGGYPRSLLKKDNPSSLNWRKDFISTFLERDLLQWSGFSTITMGRLWQMLAHLNGQMINYSMLGGSLGVSHTTIRNYIELLQSTFMVEIVQPFHGNFGKRLIKSPKVYIADSGIASALLDLKDFTAVAGHPSFGSIWESVVLANIKGHFPSLDITFYRTSHGAELDFIVSNGQKNLAIECKASLSPSLSRGTYIAIEDVKPVKTLVVSPVEKGYPFAKEINVVTLAGMIENLQDLFSNQ
jgi:predicted AAA+ superfamily ATPase